MKLSITIDIDTDQIETISDSALATYWHVAQANPVDPFAGREAGRGTETIGREIIRRFVSRQPPELWHHQGGHYDWHQLYVDKAAKGGAA